MDHPLDLSADPVVLHTTADEPAGGAPPAASGGPSPASEAADTAMLTRGLQDLRLRTPGTVLGGYAQINANYLGVGPDPDWVGTASVRRLVLFVSHDFAESTGAPISAYTEFEWENAIAGEGQPGSVEVEQAFLEWRVHRALSVRSGLILVPMGVVNQWHEPPVFNGAERPTFDQLVIPSTWRELGVGVTGQPGPLRYELYLMTGLDPTGFDDSGLAGGRSNGALSPARAPAGAGRVEVEPRLGLVIGMSGYASDSGPAARWYDAAGAPLDLSLPVLGASVDARFRDYGVEARVVGAAWSLPESDDLLEALREDGSPYFSAGASPVPSGILGGYVELGFNVLWFSDTTQALVPFARLEHVDTQWKVPEGTTANPLRTLNEGTFGLSWRPVPPVVVKADVQLRDRSLGDDELQYNAGIGYMF